jgi:hypothetical protein
MQLRKPFSSTFGWTAITRSVRGVCLVADWVLLFGRGSRQCCLRTIDSPSMWRCRSLALVSSAVEADSRFSALSPFISLTLCGLPSRRSLPFRWILGFALIRSAFRRARIAKSGGLEVTTGRVRVCVWVYEYVCVHVCACVCVMVGEVGVSGVAK